MSTSQSSESLDSMDEDITQVPRARRSKVWEHYEQNLVDVDGDLKAVCKYCGAELQAKFGTSSLRSHIAESCRSIDDACRNRFLSTMKTKASEAPFVFDPKVCRELMVKFCTHAEIPFLKFEDPYLQPWIDSMQPAFQVKSRQTIRDDAKKMYDGMKHDLQVELQSLDSRICLSSDMWTSSQNLGYMSITAHYITEEFIYKKKIINFKEVKYPHTGYAIEEAIVGCLTEWGIRGKLFTLTLDNASNNTSAIDELIKYHKHELLLEGEHVHVRCCAHILNIFVQDGMKIIHWAISKIRELLKHVDSSVARLQDFNTIASRMGLPEKKSELDTYLEEACEVDTGDFDVLDWWRRRVDKFPTLSSMARDFLAIPLSMVASESAFSCGGRILGDTRSSLDPDMLQALVCAKDWLYIPKHEEMQ